MMIPTTLQKTDDENWSNKSVNMTKRQMHAKLRDKPVHHSQVHLPVVSAIAFIFWPFMQAHWGNCQGPPLESSTDQHACTEVLKSRSWHLTIMTMLYKLCDSSHLSKSWPVVHVRNVTSGVELGVAPSSWRSMYCLLPSYTVYRGNVRVVQLFCVFRGQSSQHEN